MPEIWKQIILEPSFALFNNFFQTLFGSDRYHITVESLCWQLLETKQNLYANNYFNADDELIYSLTLDEVILSKLEYCDS